MTIANADGSKRYDLDVPFKVKAISMDVDFMVTVSLGRLEVERPATKTRPAKINQIYNVEERDMNGKLICYSGQRGAPTLWDLRNMVNNYLIGR